MQKALLVTLVLVTVLLTILITNAVQEPARAQVSSEALYQIIPDSKSGCWVMDPLTGKTWGINTKGYVYVNAFTLSTNDDRPILKPYNPD